MAEPYEILTTGNKPVKAWIRGVPLEDAARKQLHNVSTLPFVHKHVAVMPDVHWGRGATIGSVIPTLGAIIPAAVGVDLGCGMMAQRLSVTSSQLPDNLKELRSAIEQAVPHGRTDNGGMNDKGAWSHTDDTVAKTYERTNLHVRYEALSDRHKGIRTKNNAPVRHLGTLGTGNHFIELCLDDGEQVWVMLHSGSRGVDLRS